MISGSLVYRFGIST